jgi:hypothetical protein
VAKLVRLPVPRSPEVHALTVDEARRLLDAVEKLLIESTNRGTDWFTRRRLKEALHPAKPTNDQVEAAVGGTAGSHLSSLAVK